MNEVKKSFIKSIRIQSQTHYVTKLKVDTAPLREKKNADLNGYWLTANIDPIDFLTFLKLNFNFL